MRAQSHTYSHFVVVAGANNLLEGILEGSSTNEESINIWLLDQLVGVLVGHRSSVQDAGLVSGLLRDVGLEPSTDDVVSLLSLLWRGSDSSADGPDWLVSNDDLAPVLDLLADGSELSGVDLVGPARLTLVELLTDASNDLEVIVEGHLDLLGDSLVGLAEDVTALTVSEDDPVEASVLEHGGTGLTSEGTIAVDGAVLGGNLHNRALEGLLGSGDVHEVWCNDDIDLVDIKGEWSQDISWELAGKAKGAIALPVSSDKQLSHGAVVCVSCSL